MPALLRNMNIQENISILPLNTFRMNGRARFLAEYESADELRYILQHKAELFGNKNIPVLYIGEGSNLLFTKDFEGVLLRSSMHRARAVRETADEVFIEADAGLCMDDLIAQLTDMQLYGLENLSYIPGTVGASAVQNVGAYGVEAKDVIDQVRVLNIQDLNEITLSQADCRFGYRDSCFKHGQGKKYIISAVTYRLSKQPVYHLEYGQLSQQLPSQPTANQIRQAVIRIRQSKLPDVHKVGSAGSFFKNPVVSKDVYNNLRHSYIDIPSYSVGDGSEYKIPAAWLIEKSGCKSFAVGDATVWQPQPLVLVNQYNAEPQDIVQLAQMIVNRVNRQFGIELQREVIYI